MARIGCSLILLLALAGSELPVAAARVDLLTSLVSYWSLDEASGQRNDSHGGNNLTDNNTVGNGTGKINNGADFIPANTESLSHTDNSDLSTGDIDFTICAWAKADDLSTQITVLAKYDDLGETNREYRISVHPSVGVVLALNVSGTGDLFHFTGTPGALSTGTWYHICGWNDSAGNVAGFSVNAGTAQTVSWAGGTRDGAAAFAIGAYSSGGSINGQLWDGIIDEVGLWKRVLTSQERTDLYNSGNGLAYPFSAGGATGSVPAIINSPLRCCDHARQAR